ADQLSLLAERGELVAQEPGGFRRSEAVDAADLRGAFLSGAGVDIDPVLEQVIDTLQPPAHADRPGDRRAANAEHGLDLVEQLERLAPFPVELVDEGHDRRIAQPADLHELDRA